MDWKDLAGKFIEFGAPTIGTALGGPIGGMVGSAIGKIAADALGVEATPEAVDKAITTGDPTVIRAQLSSADVKAQAEVDKLKAMLADVQDARVVHSEFDKRGSIMAYGPVVISIVIVLGFVILSFLAMKPEAAGVRSDVTLYLLGAWQSLATSVVGFWIGSSAGSVDKSAQLAALAAPKKK